MKSFRMDRNAVSQSTFKEADDHTTFFKNKTFDERLNHACFIINQIFKVNPSTKVDRTLTQSRKHAKSV